MATCTVLTIRIDTNGAQRSASGAVFLDPAWSIPMIQITFPPVSAKFVRLSVNLPPSSRTQQGQEAGSLFFASAQRQRWSQNCVRILPKPP